MRMLLPAAAIALSAACGGGSSSQQLAGPTPTEAQPAVSSESATPPFLRTAPSTTPSGSAPSPAVTARPTAAQAISASGYAGTATSGPGRVSSPPPSPSPRPSPSAVGGTVTVTDGDSGATIHLTVGQHLRVRLSNGTWDPPVSSAESVLSRQSSAGGYPTTQPVDASFAAIAKGSADVTSTSDAACFHTQPRCMMAQRQWQVHVVVG